MKKHITPVIITMVIGMAALVIAVICLKTGKSIVNEKERFIMGMDKSKLVSANEKIADAVASGYKKIEEGVVGGYKKIEDGVTGAFKKVEDGFVGQFLTHEGETAEDAEKRLHAQQAQREAAAKEEAEKRAADLPSDIHHGPEV